MTFPTKETTAVILAGGHSSRMAGADKTFAKLAGKSLLQHAIERLSLQVSPILISANSPSPAFPAGYPVIADPLEGYMGPLAGILAAMRWTEANSQCRWVLSVAVDTPFFPRTLASAFLDARDTQKPYPVIARSDNGLHPTFGLWPVSAADALETFLLTGGRKMQDWAIGQNCIYCDFKTIEIEGRELDPFFNINQPDDLEFASSLFKALA